MYRRSVYSRPTAPPGEPSFPIPSNLDPLLAPPQAARPPLIPPSRGPWITGWTRSTHVFPAAYPRRPTLPQPKEKVSGEELWQRRREDQAGRKVEPRGEVLWTVAERFVRHAPAPTSRAVTLVCTHANGFHREAWDTTLRYLLQDETHGASAVNEVWSLDAINQGDAALVNADELPDLFHWEDYGRDVANFLLAYLPTVISPGQLPSVLERLPESEITSRSNSGIDGRTIVGIGHSFGGTAFVLAAAQYPEVVQQLILVDPVICAPGKTKQSRPGLAAGALKRRDVWPSREEALQLLQKSKFFGRWHPDVLHDYIAHGMYEVDGNVRLKCTPYQEASAFSDVDREVVGWVRLGTLPRRLPVRFVLAGESNVTTGGDDGTPYVVWRPPNTSHVVVDGSSHLIVQEKPAALATAISEFLGEQATSAPPAKL